MNHVKQLVLALSILFNTAHAEIPKEKIPDVIVKRPALKKSLSGAPQKILARQTKATTGATTVTELLNSAGNLQLHDASGTGSQTNISMRGFGANASSNSLILLNGIPLSNADLAPPDINIIPLEDIRHIEITSGSESVLYGDQAVGGVINIVTDHSTEKDIRLQCGVGSYRSRECRAKFTNFYRSLNYQVSVTRLSSDNYREHNHYENNTLLGSAWSHNKYLKMGIDYKFTHETMQYPGALTAAQVRQNRRQASNATDYFSNNSQYLHATIKKALSSSLKFNADTFVRGMNGNGILMSPFSQSRRSAFLKPSLTYKDQQYKLKSGADFRLDYYHLGSAYGVTNNRQQQGGLFTLLDAVINEKLSASVGARGATQTTQLNTVISAYTLNRAFATTLGVTYQIRKTVTGYLRRAGNFRFPKAEESTAGYQPLRTQRGVSYETGVNIDDETRVIDISIYKLDLRDEISFDPLQTPQNPFGSNVNLSPTTRTGANLAIKSKLTKKLTGDMSINLVNARFQSGINVGKHIPLVSDVIARGGLLYQVGTHWQAYTEALFTGRQFLANDNSNIGGALGGYTIYNLNVRYHYQAFSASLHLNNIFNKEYFLYAVYQSGAVNEFFYPAPDRNVMLTFSYDFT
jgi:iron complex outermembrane receptor protein